MADSTGSLGMTKSGTQFHKAHAEISQKLLCVCRSRRWGKMLGRIYMYIHSFAPAIVLNYVLICPRLSLNIWPPSSAPLCRDHSPVLTCLFHMLLRWNPSFVPARQVLYPLNYTPSFRFYPKCIFINNQSYRSLLKTQGVDYRGREIYNLAGVAGGLLDSRPVQGYWDALCFQEVKIWWEGIRCKYRDPRTLGQSSFGRPFAFVAATLSMHVWYVLTPPFGKDTIPGAFHMPLLSFDSYNGESRAP